MNYIPKDPVGAYSQLDTEHPEIKTLTERHILDFARQIAAGMVHCVFTVD